MKKAVVKILKNLNLIPSIKEDLKFNDLKGDDVYSLNILQPLLSGKPYLPFNGGALRPTGIVYILNEILINKRSSVLEFGSGITTILIARMIKKNKLNIVYKSVEHNLEWKNYLHNKLQEEGLLDQVELIYADLKKVAKDNETIWYDCDHLNNVLENIFFDLIIVDGPPANYPEIRYARLPVVDFIKYKLKSNYCIFIDDAHRDGEKEMISFFKKSYEITESHTVSKTFYVIYSKSLFNPIPIYYQ
ncbi:class I SAM-dependent methyltransferase [Zunongwangia sp. F260]|uniref:Class I SAM-dependent methyltransferase n=1 Tax=Autumnicola lenta TaxID=3075593 RepID=A0ABU3CGA4_9FLAO|nr:class I SAM-dependent methyltransferase [Zunongwangia sp. F260]MDT0645316.1 class I SAM-dependent methyltransferase [Zunongwangia sp. F260]